MTEEDESYEDQTKADVGRLVITPSALVFALSESHRKQAAHCLREHGEIKISFQELSITNLNDIRELNGDGGVLVD